MATKPKQNPKQDESAEAGADQRAALRAAGGSESHLFNSCMLWQAAAAAPRNDNQVVREALNEATRVAMEGFAPTDAVEGLLAAQAVALHHAGMTCLGRAVQPEQTPEAAARSWREAASLSRAMVETMGALDRYRRRSETAIPV